MAEPQTFDFDIGDVRGAKGDTGNGIKSIQLLSTSGLVKTYRITMTDDTTFDFSVSDGEDGDDGNGISGASFDAETNELTITFDDGTSFTTPSLKGDPGSPGDDGYSPAITIATITGGHRVTITDKTHPTGQSFDVMDGSNDAGSVTYDETATYQAGSVGAELQNQTRHLSDKQDKPATAGTAGQVLSLDSQLNPVWADQTGGGGNFKSLLLNYLVPILYAGVYTSDQSVAIAAFAAALSGSGSITPSYSSGTLTLSGFESTPSWSIT